MPADDPEEDHVVIKIDSALSEEANKAFFKLRELVSYNYEKSVGKFGAFDQLPKEHQHYLYLKQMLSLIEQGTEKERSPEVNKLVDDYYVEHHEFQLDESEWPYLDI